MTTTAEINDFAGRLDELVERVQAGDEVLLTQGSRPVARLVSAVKDEAASRAMLQVRSLKGHRVLTPVISQTEIAEELFGQR
jgi:prevent-host-death family protein